MGSLEGLSLMFRMGSKRGPPRAIEELEKFFEATNALEKKTLKFLGWRGPAKAIKTIKKTSL